MTTKVALIGAFGLVVGVEPVADRLVALDRQSQPHPVGALGDAVVLHAVLGIVDAVGHLGDLGPHEPLGVVEQLVGGVGEEVAAVLLEQFEDPLLGHVERADHRVVVAPGGLRGAVVGEDDPPEVADVLAARP